MFCLLCQPCIHKQASSVVSSANSSPSCDKASSKLSTSVEEAAGGEGGEGGCDLFLFLGVLLRIRFRKGIGVDSVEPSDGLEWFWWLVVRRLRRDVVDGRVGGFIAVVVAVSSPFSR